MIIEAAGGVVHVCWQGWGKYCAKYIVNTDEDKVMWEGEIFSTINPQEKNQSPAHSLLKNRLTEVRTQPWK